MDEVFYRVDTTSLEGKKLLYLSPEDLRTLKENIEENEELVRDLVERPGIKRLLDAVNRQVSSAMVSHSVGGLLGSDSEEEKDKKPMKVDFLKSFLLEMEHLLRSPYEHGLL